MKENKPDNIVYSTENGYHANILPFATNVGAPLITISDVTSWKNNGINTINKSFESKFKELKLQYENLMEEYEWNEIVYNSKFSFEPVMGETYHLYSNDDGTNFLSLIAPNEWNKTHIESFTLNSDKKWIKLK